MSSREALAPVVVLSNRVIRYSAPPLGEVAEDGVEMVRDAGTDARRTVVPRVPSEPSKTEGNEEEGKKEDKAA